MGILLPLLPNKKRTSQREHTPRCKSAPSHSPGTAAGPVTVHRSGNSAGGRRHWLAAARGLWRVGCRCFVEVRDCCDYQHPQRTQHCRARQQSPRHTLLPRCAHWPRGHACPVFVCLRGNGYCKGDAMVGSSLSQRRRTTRRLGRRPSTGARVARTACTAPARGERRHCTACTCARRRRWAWGKAGCRGCAPSCVR